MSNEISMFEKLGGTYREVDGILYPNIGMDVIDTKFRYGFGCDIY